MDAEILIYDNTSDVSVSTVADILANGDYLADMKAIQEATSGASRRTTGSLPTTWPP